MRTRRFRPLSEASSDAASELGRAAGPQTRCTLGSAAQNAFRLSETTPGLNRMPHSMTGFSTAEARVGPFRLVWEIRSVNHRFLELGFRLPDDLRGVEPDCRELAGAALKRGKVDCTLKIGAGERAQVADMVVAGALERLRSLEHGVRRVFPEARPLTAEEVLRWPGVLEEPAQNVEELGAAVKACLEAALRALTEA